MNNLKHILIGGVVAASVLAPSAVAAAQAAPASAALSFTTVETLGQAGHEGKQQACKLLVTIGSDTYWKINNRLDGRTLRGGSLHATMSVYRGSTKTSRVWQSGEVKPGGLSAVGSILFPHTRSGVPVTGISLVMTIYGANFGNGGPLALGNIGHC